MAAISDKCCMLCKHFSFDAGWGGTDVTPGEPAQFGCRQDVFPPKRIAAWSDEGDLRTLVSHAKTCVLYEHHES